MNDEPKVVETTVIDGQKVVITSDGQIVDAELYAQSERNMERLRKNGKKYGPLIEKGLLPDPADW
jgi:hypothetical protein